MKQWLKNRIRPWLGHSWVLMYHRIDMPAADPWDLAVRPEVFDAQLRWLKANRKVLPLADLVQQWKKGKLEKHSVAISFDDGYLDNLTAALPLLEQYELPASFFLCTGVIRSGAGYWWDLLQELLFSRELPPGFVFHVREKSFATPPTPFDPASLASWRYPQPPPDDRARLFLDLWMELRMLPHDERHALLVQWAGSLGRPLCPIPVVSQAQVHSLAQHPLITIGAHTVNHAALQYLDAREQEEEMLGSKKGLEEWTGRPVGLIAYPYGSYGPDTFSRAGSLGFEAGFTTQPVAVNKAADAWSIGRYMVTNSSRLEQL